MFYSHKLSIYRYYVCVWTEKFHLLFFNVTSFSIGCHKNHLNISKNLRQRSCVRLKNKKQAKIKTCCKKSFLFFSPNICICVYGGQNAHLCLCVPVRLCLYVRSGLRLHLSQSISGQPSCGGLFSPITFPAGGWCPHPPMCWWFSVTGAGCSGVY